MAVRLDTELAVVVRQGVGTGGRGPPATAKLLKVNGRPSDQSAPRVWINNFQLGQPKKRGPLSHPLFRTTLDPCPEDRLQVPPVPATELTALWRHQHRAQPRRPPSLVPNSVRACCLVYISVGCVSPCPSLGCATGVPLLVIVIVIVINHHHHYHHHRIVVITAAVVMGEQD